MAVQRFGRVAAGCPGGGGRRSCSAGTRAGVPAGRGADAVPLNVGAAVQPGSTPWQPAQGLVGAGHLITGHTDLCPSPLHQHNKGLADLIIEIREPLTQTVIGDLNSDRQS